MGLSKPIKPRFLPGAWLAALIAALVVGGGMVATAAENPSGPIFVPPANQNISGVWWIQKFSPRIEVAGGGQIPFTPEGQKQYQQNMAGLKAGTLIDKARRICLPDGVPRILGNPFPFQIIQTKGQVTFIYELNRVIRVIPLDKPLPSAEDLEIFPFFSGHPVARWRGDTLDIETAGFKDGTFLDATGVPHTDQMRTLEHVRRLNERTLEIIVDITDPGTFTRPWSARFVYDLHPDVQLETYVCGEPHRDISKIPGVVRPAGTPAR